jgi:hypothetical protein
MELSLGFLKLQQPLTGLNIILDEPSMQNNKPNEKLLAKKLKM